VDLPFKKKHSAIAMRDCQLLFEPYSTEQLVGIFEEKINMLYHSFPSKMKTPEMKQIFFRPILDSKASEFVARKVAKQNGDIRSAFDIIKTSFSMLYDKI
jgi:Cdc6-like AAA superfamily ATPase